MPLLAKVASNLVNLTPSSPFLFLLRLPLWNVMIEGLWPQHSYMANTNGIVHLVYHFATQGYA